MQFSVKSLRPFSLSADALTTEPPVPHADSRSATATPPTAAESRPNISVPPSNARRLLARDHAAPESTLAFAKAAGLGRSRVRSPAWCSRPRNSPASLAGTLGRRLVGRFHVGDGLDAGRVDREHAVEPGDLEDLRDVPVAADERELPLVRTQPFDATDEHAEGGRVDEGRVAEVDDHLLPALADHFEELLLELGRGVQVDLA